MNKMCHQIPPFSTWDSIYMVGLNSFAKRGQNPDLCIFTPPAHASLRDGDLQNYRGKFLDIKQFEEAISVKIKFRTYHINTNIL